MNRLIFSPFILGAALLLLLPGAAMAAASQEAPQAIADGSQVTAAQLQAEIDEVKSSGLSSEKKQALQTQLENGLALLASASAFASQAEHYQQALQLEPQETERLRLQLDRLKDAPAPRLARHLNSPETLQAQLNLALARYNDMEQQRLALQQQIDAAAERAETVQSRMAELRGQLRELDAAPADLGSALEQQTSALLLLARRQVLNAELRSLEAELLSEPLRAPRRLAERSLLERELELANAELQLLRERLQQLQISAGQQELDEADALLAQMQDRYPLLVSFAADNRALAEKLRGLIATLSQTDSDAEQVQKQLAALAEDLRLVKRRLEAGGRKDVLGRMMLALRDSLPNVNELERDIGRRTELLGDLALSRVEAEEELRALRDSSGYLQQHFPDHDQLDGRTQTLIARFIEQRRELLERATHRQEELNLKLTDTNSRSHELVELTRNFQQFLMGNLLWVRDYSFASPALLWSQLRALFAPSNWLQLPAALGQGVVHGQWEMLGLLLMLALALGRRWLQAQLQALLQRPHSLADEHVGHSGKALLFGLLLVLPWPLLLYVTGRLLLQASEPSIFITALGRGLGHLSMALLVCLLVRQLVAERGIGERFFPWHPLALEILRRQLRWFLPTVSAAFFVVYYAIFASFSDRGGPLAAVASMVIVVSLVLVAWRLHQPVIIRQAPVGRMAVRAIIVVGSIVLLLPLLGTELAAKLYTLGLVQSILLLLLVKVVGDLLERWLLILRIRLQRADNTQPALLNEEGIDTGETAAEAGVRLSEAHNKLLNLVRLLTLLAGLWLIWSPNLPALNLFESMTLWTVNDSVNGVRSVTLVDLILALFILVVTFIATRHLPSLLQVIQLEFLRTSASVRYASTMLLQYALIAIGVSQFVGTLGWQWSQVQWLVAALGVGIGFGLQEIVANFISGLILLFERPISVGDVVTVDGHDGTVKRINIRATVIETFDRKELFVPNKDLITKQVVNWTHSDTAVRVLIGVGVAYGSDVRRAMALMLKLAEEHPKVLQNPPPQASFDNFGDNSLMLTLRCFIAEERLAVSTELRTAINDRFAAEGIEISYPQRDLHVEFKGPLQIQRG